MYSYFVCVCVNSGICLSLSSVEIALEKLHQQWACEVLSKAQHAVVSAYIAAFALVVTTYWRTASYLHLLNGYNSSTLLLISCVACCRLLCSLIHVCVHKAHDSAALVVIRLLIRFLHNVKKVVSFNLANNVDSCVLAMPEVERYTLTECICCCCCCAARSSSPFRKADFRDVTKSEWDSVCCGIKRYGQPAMAIANASSKPQ